MSRLADELLMWAARHPQELLGDQGDTLAGKVKKLARECIELEQQLAVKDEAIEKNVSRRINTELEAKLTGLEQQLTEWRRLNPTSDKLKQKLSQANKLIGECDGLVRYIRHQYPEAAPVQCDALLAKPQEWE